MKSAQEYPRQWAEIDSLENEGLTRSALEKVLELQNLARREGKDAQIVKTILYRGKYLRDLEEDGFEAAIALLRAEMESAAFPRQAILQSMLAQLYQEYLEQYSWEIQDRTNLANETGEDIRTWAPGKFQSESARLYLASLQDARLMSISLEQYAAILSPAKNTEGLWNTLYDLLINRAMEHFANSRSYVSLPAYAFVLEQVEVFSDAADFAQFVFPAPKQDSYAYQALRLYQQWLGAKGKEGRIPALIDADIKRLLFAREHSVHPEKDSLFTAALLRLERRYPTQPGIAEAMYQRAQQLASSAGKYNPEYGETYRLDKRKAKELAEETMRRFPKSYGASECARLVTSLTQASLHVEAEEVWLPEKPVLAEVSFQNTAKAYFKLVKLTQKQVLEIRALPSQDVLAYLSKLPVLRQWNTALPDDGDLQPHRTEIKIDPLPIGHYALLFADTAVFAQSDNGTTSWLPVAVSELGYMSLQKGAQADFMLVHRDSGKPLQGVNATFFEEMMNYQERRINRREIGKGMTDADGMVSFSGDRRNFSVQFEKGGDTLFFADRYYLSRNEREDREWMQTHFFLDRAIYRPGQLVYFKGIVTVSGQQPNSIRIVPNRPVTVTLRDVNNQEVATLKLRTNEYGSFQGSFTAPQGGLLGVMSMESSIGNSRQSFLVEEYKRPRFEVQLKPMEGQVSLGETATVTGEAKMYAGSSVDGAKVQYRVTRGTRFPWWPWWRGGMPLSVEAEIAQGEVATDANGTFSISFPALPDRSIAPESLPEFQFRIHVDVTDITGETHSSDRWITLGYAQLRASMDIPEWIDAAKPANLTIRTENLNGQPSPAKVSVKVYSLQTPGRYFIARHWAKPDRASIPEAAFRRDFPLLAYAREDDPASWAQKSLVWEAAFNTADTELLALPNDRFAPGYYQIVLTTQDNKGKVLELRKILKVFNSQSKQVPVEEMLWVSVNTDHGEPGDLADLRMATQHGPIHAYFQRGRLGEPQESRWINMANWQPQTYTLTEDDRGNMYYTLHYIRHNRAYSFSKIIVVPWTNKELKIEYQTFRDKLLPGQQEEWRLRITGPKGDRAAAEVLASMYDASLDQFAPNRWALNLYPSSLYPYQQWRPMYFATAGRRIYSRVEWPETMEKTYPELEWFGLLNRWGRMELYSTTVRSAAPMATMEKRMMDSMPPPPPGIQQAEEMAAEGVEPPAEPATPSTPLVRTNLKETVFFFPELYTDAEGAVILKFTMNEALTRWKFMTLAHTKDLQVATGVREVVTQKELMVLPNLPRFVREGDELVFSAKVSNLSSGALNGTAKLEFFDALTMQSADAAMGNVQNTVAFTAEAGQSAPLMWRINVPVGGVQALVVRVSASAGNFSDAEENALPVLSNRMLVTETLPLYVRAGKKKTFTLESMKAARESKTLTPVRLSMEMTSNPAWLAVKALPYLMEYPYECAEQIFSRYYANALAASIVNSNPRIKRMFDSWKASGGLQSPLSKNQELKAVLLQETPWVLEAQSEEEQQRNIALLFDLNNMAQEQASALAKLGQMQLGNGGFPWFAGGPDNWYITQHILAGLGKLQALGIAGAPASEILRVGLEYIDGKMQETYLQLMENIKMGRINADDNHYGSMMAHYLYTRSFHRRADMSEEHAEAFEYYLNQAKAHWTKLGVMEQGMTAIALQRYADTDTAARILRSLRERAQRSDELGMYWKTPRGYFWNELPVETQSLMIEAFDEVGKNVEEVEELKIWLLKHKQTNRWATTKATADAVYALLKTGAGDSWMSNDKQVQISFPGVRRRKAVQAQLAAAQQSAEPGTGYYKIRWEGDAIQPSMSSIELNNPNKGIAWGGLYWQYMEDLDKIKSFEETPLTLRKRYYQEQLTDKGPVLREISEKDPVQPGDKVVVRLELRVDRPMEYIHMKDMRGSGLEPLNPLSAYKWQGGLGYYESPGDVATNFFIDYLPRGTYVFEYPLRVNHQGNYSNGITSIQCMYAPEFSSHTAGGRTIAK